MIVILYQDGKISEKRIWYFEWILSIARVCLSILSLWTDCSTGVSINITISGSGPCHDNFMIDIIIVVMIFVYCFHLKLFTFMSPCLCPSLCAVRTKLSPSLWTSFTTFWVYFILSRGSSQVKPGLTKSRIHCTFSLLAWSDNNEHHVHKLMFLDKIPITITT